MQKSSFVRFALALVICAALAACSTRGRYDAGMSLEVELDDAGFGRWGGVGLSRFFLLDGGVESRVGASFVRGQVFGRLSKLDAGCTYTEQGDCTLTQCGLPGLAGALGPSTERASAGVVHVRTELGVGVDLVPDAGDPLATSLYPLADLGDLELAGSTVLIRAEGDEVPPFAFVLPNLRDLQVLELPGSIQRGRDFVVTFRPTPSTVGLELSDLGLNTRITCLVPGLEGLVRVPESLLAALPRGRTLFDMRQAAQQQRRVGAWLVGASVATPTRWPDGGDSGAFITVE